MAAEATDEDYPDSAERQVKTSDRAKLFDRYAWIILGILTAIGFALTWKFFPHARENQTLGEFIAKSAVFIVAIGSVSLIPRLPKAGFLVASVPFLVFLGFVIPKMTYYFLQGPQTLPEYYTYLWSLSYPGIILSLCLAWRQGGGSAGRSIKIGLMGLVLVFSGYLDWMWFRANPNMNYYGEKTIPHVQVIIGHFPTYLGLFIYMICYIPVLAAIGIAPLDRWLDRLRGITYARPSAGVRWAPWRS